MWSFFLSVCVSFCQQDYWKSNETWYYCAYQSAELINFWWGSGPRYGFPINLPFLPCDAMYSAAIAVTRCLSVCPSVTFVSCAKTNKDIFEIFSPSGSHTILVFPHQTWWRCSDGNPLTGASNARGYEKWRFSTNISLYLRNGYS